MNGVQHDPLVLPCSVIDAYVGKDIYKNLILIVVVFVVIYFVS